MRVRFPLRATLTLLALATSAVVATPGPRPAAAAPSVGTLIDDANITTEVKAKLAAERLATLTRISVTTTNGIVYLTGTADTPEERARAANIAAGVKGVKEVVNNIQLAATGTPPRASGPSGSPATPAPLDATGTVAKVDRQNNTITLQDGRVLRVTDDTRLWQPTTIQAVQPGAAVLVRNAQPVAFEPPTGTTAWRMGTVARVDSAANRIVLTDGSALQVGASTVLHRGHDTLTLGQIQPGSEIVARVSPPGATAPATGTTASPPPATAGVLSASDVEIVWPPLAAR